MPPTADPGDGSWAEVYAELRSLAASYMRRDALHTLQPTALVNEAFLKLGVNPAVSDRAHFMATAATAMRHILVDHARTKKREKRGGAAARAAVTLDRLVDGDATSAFDVLVVEEALQRLAAADARQAKIVELRVFGGLEVEEVAAVLHVSARTVKSDWQFARAWLQRELARASSGDTKLGDD